MTAPTPAVLTAESIAELRKLNAIPKLLDTIDAQAAEIERLKGQLAGAKRWASAVEGEARVRKEEAESLRSHLRAVEGYLNTAYQEMRRGDIERARGHLAETLGYIAGVHLAAALAPPAPSPTTLRSDGSSESAGGSSLAGGRL